MATAEERALSALTQINNIGFSEFTAKLIGDTVDAVVGATIRQLKSYTELVAELEKGIDSFKAKAVTTEAVDQYLKDAFGENAVAEGKMYDKAMYDQIVARFGQIEGLAEPDGDEQIAFTAENVAAIQNGCQVLLGKAAEGSYEQLRMLVQLGYARVIFTNGRIKSKLTFDVETSDTHTRSTSDMAQSAFRASAGMRGGILGAILGVSGSTSYSRLHVRTVNERSVEADKVDAQVMGEVEVNFATQTFPAIDIQPKAQPPKPE